MSMNFMNFMKLHIKLGGFLRIKTETFQRL